MKKLILLTCFYILSLSANADQLGEKITINSEILQEQRHILVSLPESYDSERFYQYPVLYLTDASTQFNHIASTVHYLAGTISPMIVVGIFNPNRGAELAPYSSAKKLKASSEGFRKFITTEVKPFIEKTYRTADFSILSGHSFGGAFTINAYQQNQSDFDVYLSLAPTMAFGNEIMFDFMSKALAKDKLAKLYVYLEGVSTFPTPKNTFKKLTQLVKLSDTASDVSSVSLLENEDHMTVSHMGTYLALKDLYRYFFLSITPVIENSLNFDKHYEQLTKRLGYEVKPTENELWGLVNALLRSKKLDEAEYIAEKGLDYYPESHFSYSLLADVAKAQSNNMQLSKYLRKAIELSSDDSSRQNSYQKRLSEI